MRPFSDLKNVEISKKDKFITYSDKNLQYKNDSGDTFSLPKVGVWAYGVKDRFNVIETGENVKEMQAKYNIPDDLVFKEIW